MPWNAWLCVLADVIGQRSKDPRTQVGAVIARPDNTIAATGYNGFPRQIEDKPELLADRDAKYKRVIHAEMNAILTAQEPLKGYTLATSLCPCENCAKHVIQVGIARVVFPEIDDALMQRWAGKIDFATSLEMFDEAGVEVVEISPTFTQIAYAGLNMPDLIWAKKSPR